MKRPIIKKWNIETIQDVKSYIEYLSLNDLSYHFDDNPNSIIWGFDITDDEIKIIVENHHQLWNICNPWELFDTDESLWDLYRGENQ